ncbi:MAG: BTAD domain-containing putative transcriptional regulator [Dehalococcoidia bacterium]|nr:BTAD domain-containing putative transcriptional regulator [Dehalococcoidia bacterium]
MTFFSFLEVSATLLYDFVLEIFCDVVIRYSYNAAYERILDRRPQGRDSVTVQTDGAGLRMSLLGRFEVRAGDDMIIDEAWHHRNAKALLKLLAVQSNRSLHREQVLDAFWASLKPSAAAANLRKILFDLRAEFTARRVTAQVVTIADDMVVLSPEISLDIDEFRSCAQAARSSQNRLELYEEAISLYGGDLLVEDGYEEWTEGPRRELRDLHNDLLIELSQLYAAAGKLELAAERLQRLLQADPLDEDANRLMMRLYAEAGSRQKAYRQYKTFRVALRREIGAAPSEETETLIRDILAGKVGRA